MKGKLKRSADENADLKDRLKKAENENEDLKLKCAGLAGQIAGLEEEIKQAGDREAELRERLQRAEDDKEALREEMKTNLEARDEQIAKLHGDVEQAAAENQDLTSLLPQTRGIPFTLTLSVSVSLGDCLVTHCSQLVPGRFMVHYALHARSHRLVSLCACVCVLALWVCLCRCFCVGSTHVCFSPEADGYLQMFMWECSNVCRKWAEEVVRCAQTAVGGCFRA